MIKPHLKCRKNIAYLDVFTSGSGRRISLIIANNSRHDELWRRTDPAAKDVIPVCIRNGAEVFYH